MAPALAGLATRQRRRLGRVLAVAAALAAPAPCAALRSRGQESSEFSGLSVLSGSSIQLLPSSDVGSAETTGVEDLASRSRAWEAREKEASSALPSAPSATLGHFGVTLSMGSRAGSSVAAEAPPPVDGRQEPEGPALLRSTATYSERPQQRRGNLGMTSYRQAMTNFNDVQYISHITVGGQQLSGILDTGSFELVVFSKKCSTCGKAAKYDPEASKDYRKGILVSGQSYGSGSCSSGDAWDNVSLGQFMSANQSFWEVTYAQMPILYNSAFQCIIGLGPPETPQSDAWASATSAVHNVSLLLEKGQTPPSSATSLASTKTIIAMQMLERRTILDNFHSPSFSVCIGKEPGSDGFFIWNDTSYKTKPEAFVRVPVVGKHTWSVKMTNARLTFRSEGFVQQQLQASTDIMQQTWWVRHKPLRKIATPSTMFNASGNHVEIGCDGGCSALVDSGTSFLSVPTGIIDKLMISMRKLHTNCSNLQDLPHLEFELGGKLFSLPPDAYIVEVNSLVPKYLSGMVRVRSLSDASTQERGHCELAVMETFSTGQFGPLWILGLPFFRNFYTTFSVGETKAERSLYIAHAGPDCYPADGAEHAQSAMQLYRRRMDLNKIWIPSTAAKAAAAREVLL